MPQVALTVIFCVTALLVGYVMARMFSYDAGSAAGLLAGGTTESATVGTATDAINRLPIDAAAKEQMISNIAMAFAVTYFLGVITTLTLLSRLAPRMLGVDLEAECKALEKELGVIGDEHAADWPGNRQQKRRGTWVTHCDVLPTLIDPRVHDRSLRRRRLSGPKETFQMPLSSSSSPTYSRMQRRVH